MRTSDHIAELPPLEVGSGLADIVNRLARIELLLQKHLPTEPATEPHRAPRQTLRTPGHRKAGRRAETQEIALYAEELRGEGQSWKEIFKACRERWPGDRRVQNAEQIRATHRRLRSGKNAD